MFQHLVQETQTERLCSFKLAEELWPLEEEKSKDENEEDSTHEDEDEDPEKAIAKELQKLKRPRREKRFGRP